MNLIAAVDKNWAIGLHNRLLTSIPNDMKFFRETTTGGVVVMGRRTLESFPGQRPLPNRTNIVLTRREDYKVKGAQVVHSVEELHEALAGYPSETVYVIGGESVYRLLLDECDTAYITKIDFAFDADAFFPNLDQNPDWEMVEESDEDTYQDLIYHFTTYKKCHHPQG